jgi:hypothetical protein
MKDSDKGRVASLVRRIEAADRLEEKTKADKASAEVQEQQRKADMFAAWDNALHWVSDIIDELSPTLSQRNLKLAVEGSRETDGGGTVARMIIVVAQGMPPARRSLTLNLTQSGTVAIAYAGVASKPGGEYFDLVAFDREAFTDLILKFLEALIGERERSQMRKRSEMGLDKPTH